MPGFVMKAGGGYEKYNNGETAPRGEHPAVLVKVTDPFTYNSQDGEKTAVRFVWDLLDKKDSQGAPFRVDRRFNAPLDNEGRIEISTRPDTLQALAICLRDWGVVIPKSGELNDLAGQRCRLFIKHKPGTKDGRVFVNVTDISPYEDEVPGASVQDDPLPF